MVQKRRQVFEKRQAFDKRRLSHGVAGGGLPNREGGEDPSTKGRSRAGRSFGGAAAGLVAAKEERSPPNVAEAKPAEESNGGRFLDPANDAGVEMKFDRISDVEELIHEQILYEEEEEVGKKYSETELECIASLNQFFQIEKKLAAKK